MATRLAAREAPEPWPRQVGSPACRGPQSVAVGCCTSVSSRPTGASLQAGLLLHLRPLSLEKINQHAERRGHLAPTRIIQAEAVRDRSPILQHRHKSSLRNERRDVPVRPVEQADAIQGCAYCEFHIIENK